VPASFSFLNYWRFLPAILVFSFLVALKPAAAYDWSNDYGADLTVGFDDNFRMSVDNEIETTSTALGLFADIQGATEISNMRLAIGLVGTTYSETSIDDETSYNMSLETARSDERLSSFLSIVLVSQATTESELLDTGFLEQDGTRDSVSVSPGLSYQVNERNSVLATLQLQDVSYDTVSLTEYTNNSLLLSWRYQLDEMSNVSTSLQHAVYEPDDDDDTVTNNVYVNYEFRTSEATTYDFSVGYSEVERPDETEDSNDYAFGVNHQVDERNNFELELGNSYQASGEGSVREEDRLNLRWNHALSNRAQITVSSEGVKTDVRKYFSFRIGSSYRYSREVGLSASYRYRERDEDSNSADSNAVFFSMSYSPI